MAHQRNEALGFSDEGHYFNAHNATAGTGLATAAAPTGDSDTKVLLVIDNPDTDKMSYLDYVSLQPTAAGGSGASIHFTHQTDTKQRYSSGGTALTAVNVDSSDTASADCNVYAGAVTAAAAGSGKKKFGHYLMRNVIPVVGDTYRINFGGQDNPASGLAVAGTAIVNLTFNVHPVVIGPGCSWVLTLYLPSQSSASSYEFDIGWVER